MLGLVETDRGRLVIDQETSSAYDRGEMDALVKDRVQHRNSLVCEVLNRMAQQGKVGL